MRSWKGRKFKKIRKHAEDHNKWVLFRKLGFNMLKVDLWITVNAVLAGTAPAERAKSVQDTAARPVSEL